MRVGGTGDAALTAMLRQQTAAVKVEVQRLTDEMTTGTAADLGRRVGGDFGPLAGLDATLSRLIAFETAAESAALQAGAIQTTLGSLDSLAADMGAALLTAAGASQPAQLAATLGTAEDQFAAAVSLLNTRFGDRALFAGQELQGRALADAGTILTALEAAIVGAVGADEIATATAAWFADPTGFLATAYQGGAALEAFGVGPGEMAALDVTAADTGLRGTLEGLALAALLDRGALAGSETGQALLARRAGERLIETQTDRASLAARLGTVEGLIEDARTRTGAERAALEIARIGLIETDPYEASVRLEAAQSRLETIYSITARLARLSLTDFLR